MSSHPSFTDPIREFTSTQQHLPHLQLPGSWYSTASNTHHRCSLSERERDIVFGAILFHSGSKYELDAAVVMPDHFHLILRPLEKGDGVYSLAEIFHSIKSYSANRLKRKLWQDENFDHVIRNEEDYRTKLDYLIQNPVEAGLVERPEEYKWLYVSHWGSDTGLAKR